MKKVVTIDFEKKNEKKKDASKENSFPPIYKEVSYQSVIMNQLYLDGPIAGKKALSQLLSKKMLSYKHQDIKNNIFSKTHFISHQNTMEKLVESRMKCIYCRKNMLFVYDTIREDRQWTLDRIDNELGHNDNNVVICCLACNLARRNTNMKSSYSQNGCVF